jgi:hypothetical protein
MISYQHSEDKLKKQSLQKFHSNEITEKSTAKPDGEYGSSEQQTDDKFSSEKIAYHENTNSLMNKGLCPQKVQSTSVFAYKTLTDNKISKQSSSDQFLKAGLHHDSQTLFKTNQMYSDSRPLGLSDKNNEHSSVSKIKNKDKKEESIGSLSQNKHYKDEAPYKGCLYSPSINLESEKVHKKDLEGFVLSQVKQNPQTNSKNQNSVSKIHSINQQYSSYQTSLLNHSNLRDDQRKPQAQQGQKYSKLGPKDSKGSYLKYPSNSNSTTDMKLAIFPGSKLSKNPLNKNKTSSKNSLNSNFNEGYNFNSNLYEGLKSANSFEEEADSYDKSDVAFINKQQIKKTKGQTRFETLIFPKVPAPTLLNVAPTFKATISSINNSNFNKTNPKTSSNSFLNTEHVMSQRYPRKNSNQKPDRIHKLSDSSVQLYPNK